MVFPVVMYGCESWIIKKAERRRIDAFELCWRRLLRVPWTARRSNQSILKEISPGSSLEGLMLKLNSNILATWWEELTHLKRPWCWERLRAGGDGDDRGWDGWMVPLTQQTWVWVDSGSWWWTGRPGVLQFMGSQSRTRLSDWTELKEMLYFYSTQAQLKTAMMCNLPFPHGPLPLFTVFHLENREASWCHTMPYCYLKWFSRYIKPPATVHTIFLIWRVSECFTSCSCRSRPWVKDLDVLICDLGLSGETKEGVGMKDRKWEEAKWECDFKNPTLNPGPWELRTQECTSETVLPCSKGAALWYSTSAWLCLGDARSVRGETQNAQVLPAHSIVWG